MKQSYWKRRQLHKRGGGSGRSGGGAGSQNSGGAGSPAFKAIEELAPKHDNYIPIYEYREKMQGFSRKEQDAELYKLEREGKISLSNLQEVIAYSPAQINQGISSSVGGPPLFFIMIED